MFFGFALATVAIVLIDAAATGRSVIGVIQGKPKGSARVANTTGSGSSSGGATGVTGVTGGVNASGAPTAPPSKISAAGDTNPTPGAAGSRLDQGFDGTGKIFRAPFAGTVVVSEQSDSGWDGGGYVAIRSAVDSQRVYYIAEGITPTVPQGRYVHAGDTIATPRANPYNNIVGNYEEGWADPNSPTRPLAQVSSMPANEVLQFYAWIRSLGGPVATSTSNAGSA